MRADENADRGRNAEKHVGRAALSTFAVAGLLLLGGALQGGCDPVPNKPPVKTPATTGKAPCLKTRTTDLFASDSIDTRTGCAVVTKSLGSVMGASDLLLPVALVRNEGNAPSPELYPAAWFGAGEWLSVDEYISADKPGVYTLHTPSGDRVYDFAVSAPDAGWNSDPNDAKVGLFNWYRTRPFDGTFLTTATGGFRIVVGNPFDSRSLTKWYYDKLPGAAAGSESRLLRNLEKASIYKGPKNEIYIHRTYDKDAGVSLFFSSSLYDPLGITPLTIQGALSRSDKKDGFEIKAVTTLLHGWKQTTIARANPVGNIESLLSGGRSAGEGHLSSFAYWNEEDAAKTVLRSVKEEEGSDADRRTLKLIELTKRGKDPAAERPFAVEEIVDSTRPNAVMTHVVSRCEVNAVDDALPSYLTFNHANGKSVAHIYAGDAFDGLPLRSTDPRGVTTRTWYNPRAGGLTNDEKGRVAATGLEKRFFEVASPGAASVLYTQRYDKFSVDTYKLPFVGKVAFSKVDGTGPAIYRASFGDYKDTYANRDSRTFDMPFAIAGADGRARFEYHGLDGFLYESWDEDNIETRYRYVSTMSEVEIIETSVMGLKRSRTTRDRFGRLLETVDFDASLPADQQPTITYRITKDGVTDQIADSATGEKLDILGWNASRSAVTESKLSRDGSTISALNLPADDFGNSEGEGSITMGQLVFKTTLKRNGAGLLAKGSVTGPDGRTLTTEIVYPKGEIMPSKEKLNDQDLFATTPKNATAKGGCK